ncbi:MAG TPA: cobyrinate a,c-diamide synthase [Acidimicrobiales bacterium]|nr:cobyrinate a,c-diamide synthase [Acidimicrobiales bacterium]
MDQPPSHISGAPPAARGAEGDPAVVRTAPGRLGPRLVVAGTHSGVGKTTVATGLVAALRRAGHRPATAKVGPDFIDPGYHCLASGRPPRNLDAWMCGTDAIAPLAARAGAGADLLVIEGVMGLFDGSTDGASSSTADVARLLGAPVVLVVDAGAMSGSVAALVAGFAGFDARVDVAGVVLNRVGSDGHEVLLREALAPLRIPVLGALREDERLTWRDRHLGLVPVAEQPGAVAAALERLAAAVSERLDLGAVVALARTAEPRPVAGVAVPAPVAPSGRRVPVAVAAGAAFTFTYADTLDALVAAGMEVVTFDPAHEPALPDGVAGLVAGGGFPEVHAGALAANQALLADVRRRLADGLPTWAECGGLLWLCRRLDGVRLVGAVPAEARMTDRLTLGYRRATTTAPSPVGATGTVLRGHEFRYSTVDPPGEALTLAARWGSRGDGFASPTLLASYLHVHPGGDPSPVAAFARACVAAA